MLDYSVVFGLFGAVVYNFLEPVYDGSPLPVKQSESQTSAVQMADNHKSDVLSSDTKGEDIPKKELKFVQLYQRGRPLPFRNKIIGQTITEEELNEMVHKFDYKVTYP